MPKINKDFLLFEKDYDHLISYSKKHVKEKRIRSNPVDLVNDAFIKFSEGGLPYELKKIKSLIVGLSFSELAHEDVNRNLETAGWDKSKEEKLLICKKCGESKPIYGFYLNSSPGVKKPMHVCITCYNKNKKEYYHANLEKCRALSRELRRKINGYKERIKVSDEQKRISQNQRMRIRYLLNKIDKPLKEKPLTIHASWRKANHVYIAKQKAELTDVYIKSLLRRKFPNPTQMQIKEKRQQLISDNCHNK